jgi:hypothetical protein
LYFKGEVVITNVFAVFQLMVPLDAVGDISLVLQIAILFLLILGLPFLRGVGSKKNLMWHGYSTLAALVLHTILIFLVMVPAFTGGFDELSGLSLAYSATVWSHIILGSAAEILGLIVVVSWLSKGPSKMSCVRLKKWMSPILIIWVISIVNGAIIHLIGIL